jgi:hypothetical protein
VLGYLGLIANTAMFSTGIALIFVPVVAFLVLFIFIVRLGSSAGARVALQACSSALYGADQSSEAENSRHQPYTGNLPR